MKTGDPIVFVVDDDSSMREALTDLITSIGFLVEPFKSAREFLEHRRRDAPACLVLDVRLPGPSGLDLQRNNYSALATGIMTLWRGRVNRSGMSPSGRVG
jgi:FixJ family two-component response regulator